MSSRKNINSIFNLFVMSDNKKVLSVIFKSYQRMQTNIEEYFQHCNIYKFLKNIRNVTWGDSAADSETLVCKVQVWSSHGQIKVPTTRQICSVFYRWYSSTSSTSVPPPCKENLLIQDTSGQMMNKSRTMSEGSHQLLPHPTLKFFSHPRGH